MEYGETLEDVACRELAEETGLKGKIIRQLHTFSQPGRDPRWQSVTAVFLMEVHGHQRPRGSDENPESRFFPVDALPRPMAFDHARIVRDYLDGRI